MTKRIFHAIWLVTLSVFLAAAVLFMSVLYGYFSNVQREQLRLQTALAAQGVIHEGIQYFEDLDTPDYRITWIGTDGAVLYDTERDHTEMENHQQREEIIEALESGMGESSRYSTTLTEQSFYCAKLLLDGTILRTSVAQHSLLTLTLGMLQPICVIFMLAFALSLFLASHAAKKIVEPLNTLNLDAPLENDGYDELSPLLRRLDHQQRQIRNQQNRLQQKQQQFETVTNGMAEGIILLDKKMHILSINPAARRLFDVDLSSMGKDILSVCRSPEMQLALQQAEAGKHAETILELKEGRYQLDVSPVLAEGTVFGTVLLLLDVTEKEKIEQLRREFTANVSHELKTPLQTISGCAELMTNGLVRQENMPHFAGQIYSESQRMIHLVEDIIKLSHLDEGANGMQWESVNLYTAAQQTMDLLKLQAKSAQVTMALSGEPVEIEAIPQLIQEILYNLCENAIKYNQPGGSVRIAVKQRVDEAELTVTDTGIGIPPEHQQRIFERFYRVDKSHSKKIGGTGLGLSIVKHAAKLHHAQIAVQSKLGQGTTITVAFPMRRSSDDTREPNTQ